MDHPLAERAADSAPSAARQGRTGGPGDETEFSLVEGGPLYDLARTLGLIRPALGLIGPGLILALATWTPLLLLTATHGAAVGGGVAVSFLASVGTHARFLVAIPLFFVAEAWVDPVLRRLLQHLVDARIVPPSEAGALRATVRTSQRLRASRLAEVVILAMAVSFAVAGVRMEGLAEDVSSWRVAGAGAAARLSPAGWWYLAVALPLLQFLIMRWAWRLVVWSWLLWRLSRLTLRLVPVHPDRAGGLGPLGTAQVDFCALSFALSVPAAGVFLERSWFAAAPPQQFVPLVAGIVVLNWAVFLGPLLFFGPRLIAVKRLGLRQYGLLGTAYTSSFHAKWIEKGSGADDSLLGSPDIQSLADLANAFELLRRMGPVPFRLTHGLYLAAAAVVPMLPLVLIAFPIDELFAQLVRLLLGLA